MAKPIIFGQDAEGRRTFNGSGPGGSLIDGDPGFEEARDEERRVFYQGAVDKINRENRRWRRRTGITSTLGLIWQSIWRMGMYSEDPYTARIATVHTVQQEVVNQRQMMAQQRLDDQAREEERMRMFARVMADELATRINR